MSYSTILIFIFTIFVFYVLIFISFNRMVFFVKFDVLVCFCSCLARAFAAERLVSCTSPSFACECRTWALSTCGGNSSHVCWDMTEAHTGFYTRSCMPDTEALFEWYFVWLFLGIPYWHFLYDYHTISHTEQTFFSPDVKNLIGEFASLGNCPIVVAFTHNCSRFLTYLLHFSLCYVIYIIDICLTLQNPPERICCFAGYCDQCFSKDCAWNYFRSSVRPRPRLFPKH